MSANGIDRKALEQLHAESMEEQVSYYRRPFMVLWAAVQEASVELEEDYGMSAEVAQVWVAEQLRQVADSLVDRLAEKAVAHGVSKSNVARATNALRRFPRLTGDTPRERLLIDDVLDALE